MPKPPNSWNYILTKTDMKPGFGTINKLKKFLFFKSKAKKFQVGKYYHNLLQNPTSLVDD